MSTLFFDLRYCLRGLLARPMFALIVVLTLALGIGANTAVFSLFHQMLLRPLPVAHPEELVNLSSPGPRQGWKTTNNTGNSDNIFSYPLYRDIEQHQAGFGTVAAHREIPVNLAYRGVTQKSRGTLVSGSYFPVLGLTPALGRLFDRNDDSAPGKADGVVLSHAYWRNSLGADAGVIGQTLVVNGVPLPIVGVAPAGFHGTTVGMAPDVFVPITLRWTTNPDYLPNHDDRQMHWVYLFARLATGVTAERAQEVINVPFQSVMREVEAPIQNMSGAPLEQFLARRIVLEPGARGQSSMPAQMATPLLLLLGVATLVLLTACVNIANLQLARGAARLGEMAVRAAIGASRRRLLRQLLWESALLGLAGAALALPVALLGLRVLAAMLPEADAADVTLMPAAIAFALVMALVTVLAFGLFPALQLARTSPMGVMKGQAGQPGGGRATSRFRAVLVTVQIAFSMTLLVLAGLFTQSLSNLARVDLGLRTDALLSFSLSPQLNGFDAPRARQLFDRVEADLAALPGVTSVASSTVRLLSDSEDGNNVSVEGYVAAPEESTDVMRNEVGPQFFDTVGMDLLAGRDFSGADSLGAPKVAIVNQRFVQRFGLGDNPIGKRMALGMGEALDIEIVGLVKDAAYSSVKKERPPLVFLANRQNDHVSDMTFYVRSALDPGQQTAAIRGAIERIDPNLPIEDLVTMREQIRENTAEDRMVGTLSSAFALLATLLAASGLYGVLSYTVAQRRREIGLRLALGAPPARLRGMVLGQIARMALVGGAIGLVAAIALGHAAEALLFGLRGHDPFVLGASVLLLGVIVFLAGYLPARRAARTDPMNALRYD